MCTTPGDFGTRLTRLEAARKELKDSLALITEVEAQHRQMCKDHADYVAACDERARETEEPNLDIDKRIAELIMGIDVFIQGQQQQ